MERLAAFAGDDDGADAVVSVGGADGEGARDAARRADGVEVAVVTGGDDRRDAGGKVAVDRRLADVGVARGGVHAAAQAHVRGDHVPTRVGVRLGADPVQREDLIRVERKDARGRAGGAVGGMVEAGEHLHRDDLGARRDPVAGGVGAVGGRAAGGDAGHVRAVGAQVGRAVQALGRGRIGRGVVGGAVRAQRVTVRAGVVGGEAVLGDDAAAAGAEERMVRVDAGVQDGDGGAGTREPEVVDVVAVDHRQRAGQRRRRRLVLGHGPDVRVAPQPADRRLRHLHDQVGQHLGRADLCGCRGRLDHALGVGALVELDDHADALARGRVGG